MRVSDIEKPKDGYRDSRLESSSFKEAVRVVLESLGEVANRGNFKKYDPLFNWIEMAEAIRRESEGKITHHAVVEVLNRGEGTEHTVLVDLVAGGRAEALKQLNTSAYRFREWW